MYVQDQKYYRGAIGNTSFMQIQQRSDVEWTSQLHAEGPFDSLMGWDVMYDYFATEVRVLKMNALELIRKLFSVQVVGHTNQKEFGLLDRHIERERAKCYNQMKLRQMMNLYCSSNENSMNVVGDGGNRLIVQIDKNETYT